MRKRFISPTQEEPRPGEEDWLNLADLADVEVSSEDKAHPIEVALLAREGDGWRAAQPGNQRVRICFRRPQRIRRIRLEFVEPRDERTQEYVLRWLPVGAEELREIVRQQWNFSPSGATVEIEDHRVQLSAVRVLELDVTPNIADGRAYASLSKLRIA